MFLRGFTSIYQTVTSEGQGLSWELKVAAQDRQRLFLQEIEERFIAPLPPALVQQVVGTTLGRTGRAQVSDPSNLADPDFQVPANRKKLRCHFAVPSTREGNSPIPVPLDSVPPAMRALHLRI